jgi:hypothetical protein
MKVKGTFEIVGIAPLVKEHPRDWRISADPEDEVDALEPC